MIVYICSCVCVCVCVSANKCECDNGVAMSGTFCTKHGAAMCKECNAGFTINTAKTKCAGTCFPCPNPNPYVLPSPYV